MCQPTEAVERYSRFVAAGQGQPAPWAQLKAQLFLGSDEFVDTLRRNVPLGGDLREIPQARARPAAKPLGDYAREYADRDCAIAAAYASGGYTMKAISDHFGLHYSRISKIVRKAQQARGEN